MPYKIAVCDQGQLFREGIKLLLDPLRFDVAVAVQTISEIVTSPMRSTLHLIIIGADDSQQSREAINQVATMTKDGPPIVMLANLATQIEVVAAMKSGIYAVLSKDISGDILCRALELVLLGQRLFPLHVSDTDDYPAVTPIAGSIDEAELSSCSNIHLPAPCCDNDIRLSEREEQILGQLVAGASNKSIARSLAITEATVKVHLKGLLRKLRVVNRTQAAIWKVNSCGLGSSRVVELSSSRSGI